jgi:molybdopterin synthase sulfur carrier subunit
MRLLYFAWLRARIGCAEEEIPLPPQVHNVAELLDWLRRRSDRHADTLRNLGLVRVAVNQEYVGSTHPVREGDEVALFPPVTGG